MKKANKKGFTIVELVIVIAVIAILAAVLIPTFSNVVEKANQSAALQNCRNELVEVKAALAINGEDIEDETVFVDGNYKFVYKNGELSLKNDAVTTNAISLKNVKVVYAAITKVEVSGDKKVKITPADGYTLSNVYDDNGVSVKSGTDYVLSSGEGYYVASLTKDSQTTYVVFYYSATV